MSCCLVPACGMQAPPLVQAVVNPGTVSVVGPVKVLAVGLAKLAWNLKTLSVVVDWRFTRNAGDPAGGAALPSRSDGKALAMLEVGPKQIWVAD